MDVESADGGDCGGVYSGVDGGDEGCDAEGRVGDGARKGEKPLVSH